MDTRFIEASTYINHGKFMVARFDHEERLATTALPGMEGQPLFMNSGGLRRLNPDRTLVVDLQTGEGAEFSLSGGRQEAKWALEQKHPRLWICPLFAPFLGWLFDFNIDGLVPLTDLPRHIDLNGKDRL